MRSPFRAALFTTTSQFFSVAIVVLGLALSPVIAAKKPAANVDLPKVVFETDLGKMVIELYPEKAPKTVANFLAYVDAGFYNGTIFHRVVNNFVVQGGGYTYDFQRKETRDPVVNESNNGLLNEQATLSMARTSDPDSATSQFFINLKHNTNLDPEDDAPGYAVFGKVIEGFEVAKKIEKEPRGLFRNHPEAPNYAVRILRAQRLAPVSDASTTAAN
ncbi:peptidylprolyl isomerase [Teredinibacter waterburyi]|uniref:peptidylprolyl isomerase n=1 Tax=Teredinibacter waterburyi TaxID=1500538 RepID=UPI00165F49F5|nr:peptidylprolyl isomerase [Teredinibacter waterburyi]